MTQPDGRALVSKALALLYLLPELKQAFGVRNDLKFVEITCHLVFFMHDKAGGVSFVFIVVFLLNQL